MYIDLRIENHANLASLSGHPRFLFFGVRSIHCTLHGSERVVKSGEVLGTLITCYEYEVDIGEGGSLQ